MTEIRVRTYREERNQPERVVIDFEVEATADAFLVLSEKGGTFHIGWEKVSLDWESMKELAELMLTGFKTLRPNVTRHAVKE